MIMLPQELNLPICQSIGSLTPMTVTRSLRKLVRRSALVAQDMKPVYTAAIPRREVMVTMDILRENLSRNGLGDRLCLFLSWVNLNLVRDVHTVDWGNLFL